MISDDEIVSNAANDLLFLKKECHDEVDDDALRRSSPILRRFLAEGELHHAWKLAGFEGQALIRAHSLAGFDKVLASAKRGFASAGGVHHKGATISGAMMIEEKLTDEQVHAMFPPPEREEVGLVDFPDMSVIWLHGETFNRRQVIKYAANFLGGAHSSTKPTNRKREALVAKSLNEAREKYRVRGKPAVWWEVLGATQPLLESEDLSKFVERVTKRPL